jgi:thiol-disulfide isomerase/thioredoxin
MVLAILGVLAPACSSGSISSATPQAIDAVTPASFRSLVASMKGKPLVVNFWATWCDPCKAEMPRLARAAKKYAGRVDFLGVDVQDDSTLAARFAARAGVTYRSVADPRRAVVGKEGIFGLPVTQFYTAAGRQREKAHQGEIKSGELNDAIERLLRAG